MQSDLMMRLDLRWMWFQVCVPLVLPVLLAALFAAGWWTLEEDFSLNIRVIADVTPWALSTYSLVLIGGTFERRWSDIDRTALSWLWCMTAANIVYYGLMIIKRHQSPVVPEGAYFVSGVLMVASIIICYRMRR